MNDVVLKIDPKSLGALGKRIPVGPRYSGFLRNLHAYYYNGISCCSVYDYVEKADLRKGYQNPKKKLGVSAHF